MWKLGIITVAEIIHIVSELGKENKIVGNKSEEDLAAVLADTLCFADTFLFVRIIFQMIKRAEQKDNIKRLMHIERGQGHGLEQDRFYLRVSVSF